MFQDSHFGEKTCQSVAVVMVIVGKGCVSGIAIG